ncbi:ABC transporter permease subunit [Streptomyces sp. NBC_01481]|uniref:ABC transporter permease subunit n=1 Tax=Streptomyces sp. NBC_01481 TaxID=2975869 RepID=UPI002250E7EA|nr:ABC transporter permease subunit [Streptomyces sp. NBC_01481]MCX4587102.1 ABC transporter permease [Streptomyces sp. NBC_01481]
MSTPYQQQATYQQHGAPAGTYSSPIPVRSAHLGDALASEWTKIRSVRSTMWTLGVMIVLMIGLGVLAAVAASASEADLGDQSPLFLGFYGVLLGSICVVTLGVLTIASEFGTGMIRTTLTACPGRARVLAAKALVFFVLVFTLTTVLAGLVGALQNSIVTTGRESTGEEWFRATVGVGLFVAVLGLLALAIGTIIRHSAGAITIMIGVMLLPLVAAMFMFSEALKDVQRALLDYAIPSLLIAFYSEAALTDTGPTGWTPLWILIGVTAVAMAGAFFSLQKRDV